MISENFDNFLKMSKIRLFREDLTIWYTLVFLTFLTLTGMNTAYDAEMAGKNYAGLLRELGCDDLDCVRAAGADVIGAAAENTAFNIRHPTKLTLEPGFSPSVDGKLLRDQLVTLVHDGKLKKESF